MTCGACDEAREIDGDIPDCETERGCRVPPLTERGARVLALREKLVHLRRLVDPATVLAIYGAGPEELDLLAAVEKDLVKPKA